MSATIVRPTFYEGEILSAADLVATVDSPRAQLARHDRYLHRWGIASGLQLKSTKLPTGTGVSIVLTQGVAKDGTGREVIVPADVPLNPADFSSSVNGKPEPWYPVFLNGRDEQATGTSLLTGACTNSLPTQIKENYDISYGNPGSEQALDEQTVPTITDGPGDGVSSNLWLILLGFVRWAPTPGVFAAVADSSPDSAVVRRYVGVNAAQVVSGSGTLQLATHPTGSPDAGTIMALEIHEDNQGELIFGKHNPDGSIARVLTVNSKGDLTATGKVTGAVTPGSMQVQSGIASDGMILPLPIGIDPASVTAGKVTLFIHLTPRHDLAQPPVAGSFVAFPYECHVDADTRQVHCRLRWWDTSALPAATLLALPAPCDYMVIAAVAATGSGA